MQKRDDHHRAGHGSEYTLKATRTFADCSQPFTAKRLGKQRKFSNYIKGINREVNGQMAGQIRPGMKGPWVDPATPPSTSTTISYRQVITVACIKLTKT